VRRPGALSTFSRVVARRSPVGAAVVVNCTLEKSPSQSIFNSGRYDASSFRMPLNSYCLREHIIPNPGEGFHRLWVRE